jgi:hypothetical protein
MINHFNIMDKEWALFYTSNKMYEIEILKGLLLENNIESFVMNKQDSLYLIGEVELHVPIDDMLKAKIILSENQ